METILVTGGAGFIGSNFIRHTLKVRPQVRIVNLDALTYAGNPTSLDDVTRQYPDRYRFVHGTIGDEKVLAGLLDEERPEGVFHFAAESHVDRSIKGPMDFVETNVTGTCRLLSACHSAWKQWGRLAHCRFLHISTDEVFGSLGPTGFFSEQTPYDPSSPYSASKAASDHFVRAWHRTYDFPALITNCSNNYGPYQFPEKLIPLMILNLIEEIPLPVYGDGSNVRDWLYVIDHCEALLTVFEKGVLGETYAIGGAAERKNIDVVYRLCEILDQRMDRSGQRKSERLITFVPDRPGHDQRYAIDAAKIRQELGWQPGFQFEEALSLTVDWYLENTTWVDNVRSGHYRKWIDENYAWR